MKIISSHTSEFELDLGSLYVATIQKHWYVELPFLLKLCKKQNIVDFHYEF